MTTKKLTKKQQEQLDTLLKRKANKAIALTIIGFFVLGIPLNIWALVCAVDVKKHTKDQSNYTKAIVVMVVSIIQLVIDAILLLVSIGEM